MTREEAINILDRRTTIPGDGFTYEQINEAVDMAIAALRGPISSGPTSIASACRLMRVAAKVLATVDSMDPDYSIVATLNGEEYTIQDVLLGMCELVSAWEGDRDD